MKPSLKIPSNRGLTLMETVIAIGVVAFAVPMFLAMAKSAGESRLRAEADTRSAWLAREVQREVSAKWTNPSQTRIFSDPLGFPAFASESAPVLLAYDVEGNFISPAAPADFTSPSGIRNASYLVSIHGESYTPPSGSPASGTLCLLHIRVSHPARAAPENRRVFHYKTISPLLISP